MSDTFITNDIDVAFLFRSSISNVTTKAVFIICKELPMSLRHASENMTLRSTVNRIEMKRQKKAVVKNAWRMTLRQAFFDL